MSVSRYSVLVLLFGVLWFAFLGYRQLITPDEGRYAEIAREMALSHDWVTPRLNGVKYFEKPPLQYWATAVAFRLLGDNEFSARLWPALMGLLSIVAVWLSSRYLWGRPIADYAAMLSASMVWIVANSHFLSLDMGVSAYLSVALCAFLVAQHDQHYPRYGRKAMLVCWGSMGLAVLSKGLIGLVLPAAVITLYILWQRDWRLIRRLHWLWGISLLLAITLPWFILVSWRNPEFAAFFFIHEHLQRFALPGHGRLGAWWYFVPILLLGTLPWTSLLLPALYRGWQRSCEHFQPQRLLWLWCTFIFLFFSQSSSKLPSYILPIFPALAMLMAVYVADLSTPQWRRMIIYSAVIHGLLAVLLGYALTQHHDDLPVLSHRQFAYWLAAAVMVMLLGLLTAYILAARLRYSILSMSIAMLIAVQLAMLGHNSYAQYLSGQQLARLIQPWLDADTELYSVQYYDQSLPFYLKRTMTLVDYRDEFSLGIAHDSGHHWIDSAAFVQRWQQPRKAIAVMGRENYQQFNHLAHTILYQDNRRVVIRKTLP